MFRVRKEHYPSYKAETTGKKIEHSIETGAVAGLGFRVLQNERCNDEP